jgi:hypothetical protein
MKLCEWEEKGNRLVCRDCPQTTRIVRPYPIAACDGKGEGLVFNDLSLGPCVHRGALVAIERCRIGCQREKRVETFLCLPDPGCHGPAPIASETQFSHAQTLNRRREVCVRCVRYVGLSNASGEAVRD